MSVNIKNALPLLRCFLALPGSGDPVDFSFNHAIRPTQIRWEFEQLADVIRCLKPKFAMEIGTCHGGTLYVLCRLAHPHATIISLDLRHGAYGGGYRAVKIPIYRRFAFPTQNLHLVRADSHSSETLERITKLSAGNKLDYLFIDGDHTYEGVKLDFEMYSPLVRQGGIIAFHDIVEHPPETKVRVASYWNEIKGSFRYREIIENQAQGSCGIGLLYV